MVMGGYGWLWVVIGGNGVEGGWFRVLGGLFWVVSGGYEWFWVLMGW